MEATTTLDRRVRVIPATKTQGAIHSTHDGKKRVAAYCRVSTDSEEQLNSYEAQKSYYTQKIEDKPGLGDGGHLCRRGHLRHQHEKAGGVQ